MSSEEVVHLDTVRTSSVLANARKGTAKSRIISGERSDVTVWSFSEDAPDGKVSYVTDATVMVSGPPNVLVGMTTRSFGRDDKLTQVVLQLLGNADIETKYPAYPSSLSAEATRRVGLLLQRVDTYHLLLAKGKYRDAINIWSDEYTSDTDVVERNINEMKRWGKRGSPSSWEIVDVWLMEDYARVHLVLSGNQEGQGQSSDKTREFWVYDGSLWYVIPKQLPAWEESRAIRVPLAEVR